MADKETVAIATASAILLTTLVTIGILLSHTIRYRVGPDMYYLIESVSEGKPNCTALKDLYYSLGYIYSVLDNVSVYTNETGNLTLHGNLTLPSVNWSVICSNYTVK